MPATRATRITDRDHRRLLRLAEATGQSHVEVLGRALDMFERQHMLDALQAGFDRLRADDQAWSDELRERADWDVTSADKGRE